MHRAGQSGREAWCIVPDPRNREPLGWSREDAVSDICAAQGLARRGTTVVPGGATSVRTVADPPFVPTDFAPPTALVSDHFRLEPLGPQHNEADHTAWTSSIAHVRSTPGFPDGNWPPPEGMSLDRNLDDLRRHAADFEARTGFTFTVVEPVTGDVIGCVYLYPAESQDADVTVQSWVRASHAELDVPLADAVAAWLAAEWPWERVHRPGR
jgi:hypothetical protein